MEITNVRIKNVTVGLDSRHNLSARMTFENQYATCDWSFSLTDPVDVHRLMKLMSYAGTNTVQKPKRKNRSKNRSQQQLPWIRRSYQRQIHSGFW